MARREKLSDRNAKKCAHLGSIIVREELKARKKQVSQILEKDVADRSPEELQVLRESPDVVKVITRRNHHKELAKQRQLETEDPPEELEEKCRQLAAAIREADGLVIYTGAGISTAASIPDYRGPNGVWTLLQQGKELEAQDLSDAEPTYTHRSIVALFRDGYVKHIVSQNCDGLHLRSGLPRDRLSELHGNMYIEHCHSCQPRREYIRLFDVTERTGIRKHRTQRDCHVCGEELRDTIVHFGEKGTFNSPYNWKEAAAAADNTSMILCLGSSLKVLKRYPCLWSMHKGAAKRPKLYIVNLQWTPKDDMSTLKINGKCDEVMKLVMDNLGLNVASYERERDPIFELCTTLNPDEQSAINKKVLEIPDSVKCMTLPQVEKAHLRCDQDSVSPVKGSDEKPPGIKPCSDLEQYSRKTLAKDGQDEDKACTDLATGLPLSPHDHTYPMPKKASKSKRGRKGNCKMKEAPKGGSKEYRPTVGESSDVNADLCTEMKDSERFIMVKSLLSKPPLDVGVTTVEPTRETLPVIGPNCTIADFEYLRDLGRSTSALPVMQTCMNGQIVNLSPALLPQNTPRSRGMLLPHVPQPYKSNKDENTPSATEQQDCPLDFSKSETVEKLSSKSEQLIENSQEKSNFLGSIVSDKSEEMSTLAEHTSRAGRELVQESSNTIEVEPVVMEETDSVKRKATSSVPGWFGKGMVIKRNKRKKIK